LGESESWGNDPALVTKNGCSWRRRNGQQNKEREVERKGRRRDIHPSIVLEKGEGGGVQVKLGERE